MPEVVIVVGLGFGDEGKGGCVDYLCRKHQAHLVCRFNGGHQAGHNVVIADGRHHCFSQWGSGTFAGAETYLSRYMIVNPTFLQYEEEHLQSVGITDAYQRLAIDGGALVTTPFHVAANRFRELHRSILLTYKKTGTGRHGSCGVGIGETVADALQDPAEALRVKDFGNPAEVKSKLEAVRLKKLNEANQLMLDIPVEIPTKLYKKLLVEYDILEDKTLVEQSLDTYLDLIDHRGVRVVNQDYLDTALESGTVIFEGAQGVLLDEEWGIHPHTTWSNCTFGNALELIKGFSGKVTRMGVTRTYLTRHGTGPFPSEDLGAKVIDHNSMRDWQGIFRVGHLDFCLLRYARETLGKVDEIAISHLDQVQGPQKVCLGHNFMGDNCYRMFGLNYDQYLEMKKFAEDEGEDYYPILSVVSPVFSILPNLDRLISGISKTMRAPITIFSYGPTAEDKEVSCRR
jgi:adenylosuccinate synthase